jgi:hypothetical protein
LEEGQIAGGETEDVTFLVGIGEVVVKGAVGQFM